MFVCRNGKCVLVKTYLLTDLYQFFWNSLDLNQLTGVAAILNFPLPDIDDDEHEELPYEEEEEEPMHSNKNHEILDAVLG